MNSDATHTDILTLELDPASQAHFNEMRQRHFPPALNRIDAHLTLFHQLPESDEVHAALLMAAQQPRFTMQVTGLRSLGRGVAYVLESPELMRVHRQLSAAFDAYLTPQDRQRFQPHVVIQNKATCEEARALKALLGASFRAFPVEATGLELWRYLNGPWQLRERIPFTAS